MSTRIRSVRTRQVAASGFLIGILFLGVSVTGSARLERADFILNNGQEITSLDPTAVTGIPEGRVMNALYEGLTVKHPETLLPLPGMARSWEISPDGRTYTFHLRPDARWNNGDALTAADFEWSWQRLLLPETAAEYAYQLWYLENARRFSLTPGDTPGDRWWFDETAWLHWNQDTPKKVRSGLHLFADLCTTSSPEDAQDMSRDRFRATLTEKLGLAPGSVVMNREFVAGSTPDSGGSLAENWIAEVQLGGRSLEELTSGFHDAESARAELFWPHVGARALDATTFQVTLEAPTPFFLDLVSFYPTFPVHRPTLEAARETWPDTWQVEWLRPERIVTNGPYELYERRINDRIRLRKNPHYWDAASVAMRTIDILAVEHYGTMLNLYLTGEIDWLDRCAPNLIPRMLPREDFNPEAYLGAYFYRVNTLRPPFDDVRVRRALALAVDRRAICEKITKNGERPLWGLCPDGLGDYQPSTLAHADPGADLANYDSAFREDCEEARALLSEAGFGAGGRELPTVEILYNTSEVHRDVAEVVADTWRRVLGVDARLLNQEWKVYLDSQNTLAYDVCRAAWIGDYPDPNTFIDIFLTGGENNRTGWGNPDYDELVRRARMEVKKSARLELLARAEALLMDELPIIPIYGYAAQNVVNPRLGGFHANIQDVHFPKFFYWMDDAELARKRAQQPEDWERVAAPGPSQGLYASNPGRTRSL